MTPEELAKLTAIAEQMQDRDTRIVLLVLIGNAHCGASNAPIAEFCVNVARQMLADMNKCRKAVNDDERPPKLTEDAILLQAGRHRERARRSLQRDHWNLITAPDRSTSTAEEARRYETPSDPPA